MAITSPREIGDLILWLRADREDFSTLTANRWIDQSGSGLGYDPQSAGSPSVLPTGGPNSLPSVDFDAINDVFTRGSFAIGQQFTVIAVAQRNSGSGIASIANLDENTGTRIMQFRYNDATTFRFIGFNTAVTSFGVSAPTGTMTNWNILTGMRRATEVTAYLNGSQATPVATTGTPVSGTTTLRLGAFTNVFTNPLDGEVAELLIFNKALSNTEHDDVLVYLADAYDLNVTLSTAASHNGSGTRATADPEILTDAIFLPQATPVARRFTGSNDRTYFGGIGRYGTVRVAAYDHGSNKIVQRAALAIKAVDDHNHPSVLVDADGYIWVFYAKHNAEAQFYYRKSTNPEDLSAFDAEQTLAVGAVGATYPQAFQTTGGRVIVFVRVAINRWSFLYSDDGGGSWSSSKSWLGLSDWVYQRVRQRVSDPDILDVIIYWNPDEAAAADDKIKVCRIDLGSGDIFVPGNAVAIENIYTGPSNVIDPATDPLTVYDPTGPLTAVGHDINEHGEIVFDVYDPASPSGGTQKYVRVNEASGAIGTVRDLVAVGGTVNANIRGGGMHLTDAGRVVYLTKVVSGDHTLERWTTNDEGETWDTVREDPAYTTGAIGHLRPISVRFQDDAPQLFYNRVTVYNGFTDYISDIVILASELAAEGPDKPTVTVTATGPRSLTLASSDYVHDASLEIAAVQWEIATDEAFTTGVQSVEIPLSGNADIPEPFEYPGADFDIEPSTEYFGRVRHQDSAGVWSDWSDSDSDTTEAESGPTTPSITFATPTATTVALGSSAYADGEGRTHVSSDWQIDVAAGDFSSPVAEVLDDVSDLTNEDIAGLTAATNYKARVRHRASDGSYSAWSASFPFTTLSTPASRPTAPTVSVSMITQTTARFTGSAYSDPGPSPHLKTRIFVSSSDTGSFSGSLRVLDVTVQSPDSLTVYDIEDLDAGQTYTVAYRYQATDGDWSDWGAWKPFTMQGAPLNGQLLQVLRPRQGAVVRGSSVTVSWTPGYDSGTTFRLEYSIDNGITWLPLASGVTSSPYSWNVSALTDGVYKWRIRAEEGSEVIGYQYGIVYVDNANALAEGVELFNTNADEPMDLDDWEPAWEEDGITWSIGAGGDVRYTGPGTSTFESALTYLPAFEPRQVDVIGEVLIGSTGGSFPWQWFPEQCWAGVGVFAAGPVTGTGPRDGVTATIYAIPINAYGGCGSRGSGTGFLEIAVYENGKRILTSITPEGTLGRVHVVNLFSGCNKVPRYGIRLRLTTIADLPGARRRLRVQAVVVGRGINVPASGWHYEGTVETGLDCGCAAFTARQITTTRNPYRSFSNLTVIPYEYGACSAPEEFPEPLPDEVESCPPPFFDLTIFDDDDVTPLFGTVYGSGFSSGFASGFAGGEAFSSGFSSGFGGLEGALAISEASFSTDPAHPRPWLKAWDEGVEHEVDPIEGSSNIGTLTADVIDKRVVACDQGSGFLTSYGADDDAFSAYIGRRAVARERLSDGSIHIVANGPITDVALLDSMVTYRFTIASMREREREVPLFDTQYETVSAYPWGPVEPYGLIAEDVFSSIDLYLYDAAEIASGTFQLDSEVGGRLFGRIVNADSATYPVREGLYELGQPQFQYADAGLVSGFYYPDFVVRWRYPGDEWVYLRDMPAAAQNAFVILNFGPVPDLPGWLDAALLDVRINALEEDEDLLPEPGSTVEFQILANTAPSEAFPFFYDGSMGDLLRRIYDGEFSPSAPEIRYSEECLAEFEAEGPPARLRKFEAEDDLRDWVEKNIYQATGWLPGLDENGDICPINTAIPDGGESLVTLDNALVINANWSQDGSRATPIVTYRFVREFRQRVSEDFEQFDIVSQKVEVQRVSARAAALLRSKALVMAPETVRSLGGDLFEDANIEQMNEAAFLLALSRASDLSTLNAFGPQIVPVRVRDTPVTRALIVGDWVILDAEWIPNLSLLARGGLQLGLITRRKKDPGLAWDLTLYLAGGANPGLEVPEPDGPAFSDGFSDGFSGGEIAAPLPEPPVIGDPTPGDDNEVEVPVTPPTGPLIWDFNPGNYATEAALRSDAVLFIPAFDEESNSNGAVGAYSLNGSPPAGASSSKTMRYTYTRDNTPGPGGSGCTSITIMRSSVRFAPQQELWVEFRLQWSANFGTENSACLPGDHKLFFVDTVSDESGRHAFYVSSQGIQIERSRDPNGAGPGVPSDIGAVTCNNLNGLSQNDLWDADWHIIRLNYRCSTNTTSGDGRMRAWVDGALIHSETGFNTCKSAADGNGTERVDGVSFSHNQDDGEVNKVMTIDWDYVRVYAVDPGW